MKLFNSEANNKKIRAFNEAQQKGEYRPFLSPSFMSAGTRSIFKCPVTGRDILLLSQTEKHGYINLIFRPNVVEIKEQYPLDLQTTIDICEEEGWIHPRDHETGELKVCTTDLIVIESDKNGRRTRKAYSFKYQVELDKEWRTKQKLMLEQKYWARLGVQFELVERMQICKMTAYNLINLSNWYERDLSEQELDEFVAFFLQYVRAKPLSALTEVLREAGNTFRHNTRRANKLFANSVLRLKIKLDLSRKLEYHQSVPLL
ncbi:MAG: hypothetical protein CME69_09520 [Halobacteriovorax sp.]|uniref:TnsA endonuclease N-terminal domain-containing protein n=1 Tax=Alteromonas sp. V450 TaxID=1912139 RepID=UPI0008FF2689|nr:TnsA endonuclease N-terminal domain-containing protein [Alteromonas sp. V450]MAE59108.1 hypothetical protein [Halobacteriovorax sp.]OJF68965.1 hypothetical protein BK026_09255 [Alteromonas sp. V450]